MKIEAQVINRSTSTDTKDQNAKEKKHCKKTMSLMTTLAIIEDLLSS